MLEPLPAEATGSGPAAVTIGDFNGDGKNDIATANYGGSVSVLLGLGDGTCAEKVDYPTGANPSAIVVGDWNGDRQLDLATASGTANSVSVLFGKGDGTFGDAKDYAVGASASALAAGDFNGDERDDLAITAAPSPRVSVLLAAADGTFGTPTEYPTTQYSHSMVVGDIDGDDVIDLVSGNGESTNQLSIMLGKGDGTFAQSQDLHIGPNYANVVSSGDLNGDGSLDLGIADSGGRGWSGGVSVLLGDGDGAFPSHLDFDHNEPTSIAIGDVSGDGRLDLAVLSFQGLTVMAGAGDGTFPCAGTFDAVAGSDFVLGDLNGDDRLDVVVPTSNADSVSVFLSLPMTARLHLSAGAAPPSSERSLDPDESPQEAHYHLAKRLARHGDSTGAIVELTRALELDPAHEMSQREWGLVLERQGALEAAFEHLLEATLIHPEYRDALEDAARVADRLGRNADAARLRERARAAVPNSPRRFFYWAAYLHAHGRDAAASEEVARALRAAPGNPEALELARTIHAALAARETHP